MKKLLVLLVDWIGYWLFFEPGTALIGWSGKLDRRWNTGVWIEWEDDETESETLPASPSPNP